MNSEKTGSRKEIEYCIEFDISMDENDPILNQQFITNFLTTLKHNGSKFMVDSGGGVDTYRIVTVETASDLQHSPNNVAIFEMSTQNTCVTLKHMDILNPWRYNKRMGSSESSYTSSDAHDSTQKTKSGKPKSENLGEGKISVVNPAEKAKSNDMPAVIRLDDGEGSVMSLREMQEMLMKTPDESKKAAKPVKNDTSSTESKMPKDKTASDTLQSTKSSESTNKKQDNINKTASDTLQSTKSSESTNKKQDNINKTASATIKVNNTSSGTRENGIGSIKDDGSVSIKLDTPLIMKSDETVTTTDENNIVDESPKNTVQKLLTELYKRIDPLSHSEINESNECKSADLILGNENQLKASHVKSLSENTGGSSDAKLETRSMAELQACVSEVNSESRSTRVDDVSKQDKRTNEVKNSTDSIQLDRNNVTMIVENSTTEERETTMDTEKAKCNKDDIIIHIKLPEKSNGFEILWQNKQRPGISIVPMSSGVKTEENVSEKSKVKAEASVTGRSVSFKAPSKGWVKEMVSYYENLSKR